MANFNRPNIQNAYELQPYPQEQYSEFQPSNGRNCLQANQPLNQYNQSQQANQPIAQQQIFVQPYMNGSQSSAHPINEINKMRTDFASRKCCFSTCNVFFGLIALILLIMIGKLISDLRTIEAAGNWSNDSQDIYAIDYIDDVIKFLEFYLCGFLFWILASIFGCISVCANSNNYTFLQITHLMLLNCKIMTVCGFNYAMQLITQLSYLSSVFYIGFVYGIFVPCFLVIWVFSLKRDVLRINEMQKQIDSNPQLR